MPLLDRRALQFLALSFGFSWFVGALLALTGGFATPARQTVGGFLFMLGPAIGALIMTRKLPAAQRREALGFTLKFDRWLVVAWLVPTLLVVVATFGAGLFESTTLRSPAAGLTATVAALASAEQAAKLATVSPLVLSAGLIFQTFGLGALINAPFMLSEELGWRGYLYSRWAALGFWQQSLATGIVWGLWHAPLIVMGYNFPEAPVLGVGLMTLFCLLLAPLFQLLRSRGATVWHACLCHGTINAGARLSELCVSADHWYGRGLLGASGFIALGLTCLAVAFVHRRSPP